MKRQYHSCDLQQLCNQQVRFAPREQKIQQIDRAEHLHSELKPEQMYSYEYICFRVTDYRPDFNPQQTISGVHAGHDLRLFIEDVSDAKEKGRRHAHLDCKVRTRHRRSR